MAEDGRSIDLVAVEAALDLGARRFVNGSMQSPCDHPRRGSIVSAVRLLGTAVLAVFAKPDSVLTNRHVETIGSWAAHRAYLGQRVTQATLNKWVARVTTQAPVHGALEHQTKEAE